MGTLLTLACVTVFAAWPSAQSSQPPALEALDERVAELASELVGKRGSPGVVIGLIAGGERRVFAFGKPSTKSDQTLDENSLFEIGSVTKVFTCIALAQLTLDGNVHLEDTVQSLLPDTVTIPRSDDREIRLVDLATHHSGLPRMPNNIRPKNPLNPYADYTVEQMYEFLNDCDLRRDVGAGYEYSNLAMGLLGHALGLRDGTDYESLLQERILQPLGMKSTAIVLNEEQRGRLARGHLRNGIATLNWDIPTLAGAGALRSSVHDMLVFLDACLSPPDDAFAAALELAMKPRHEASAGMSIGLGWHMRGSEDDRWWAHNGATGGYASYAAFSRKQKMAVVVLTNRQRGGPGPSPSQLGHQVTDVVAEHAR